MDDFRAVLDMSGYCAQLVCTWCNSSVGVVSLQMEVGVEMLDVRVWDG